VGVIYLSGTLAHLMLLESDRKLIQGQAPCPTNTVRKINVHAISSQSVV